MKKSLVMALFVLGVLATPATAGEGDYKRLGTDPARDAAPALDVTYLDVAAHHGALDIRIGIETMLPGIGGYPELPGVEWIFEVGKRTFVAEAVAGTSPTFYLFEQKGNTYVQLDNPEGTYNASDGYASILVPMEDIGARSGTKISGVGKPGTEDVDAHVHALVTTYYADTMATKKDFVIP